MKREDISKAIYYDNLIERFEKAINSDSFNGIGAVEIADLTIELGVDNVKSMMKARVEELKKEIEEL